MKIATVAVAALAAALALTGSAVAATTGDLAALGYHVGVASTHDGDRCTVYSISGYGVSTYADSCAADFQATVDALYASASGQPAAPAPAAPSTPTAPTAAAPSTAPTAAAPSGGGATAADLRALGYQVAAVNQVGSCVTYYIEGPGVALYANGCDPGFQAMLDQFANPSGQCNRAWQFAHPDQLAALQHLAAKGYSVSGDQCADAYAVTAPSGTVVYSGPASGLPALDASAAKVGDPAPAGVCLPLCATKGLGAPSSDLAAGTTSLADLIAITRRILQPGTTATY